MIAPLAPSLHQLWAGAQIEGTRSISGTLISEMGEVPQCDRPLKGRSAEILKTERMSGGQGDAPLEMPPPLGERGGHPHKCQRSYDTSVWRGFLQIRKIIISIFLLGNIHH